MSSVIKACIKNNSLGFIEAVHQLKNPETIPLTAYAR